jgi:uncharacterized protein (DUF58 family)
MPAARYGALLESLRGVQWPARGLVPGTMTGAHRARARGVSSEFTEYRAYRQGDDPRRLDWRLLARSDRAYVRLSTEHAQLRTMLVADASASMAFPVDTHEKWMHCCRLVVGLAGIAHGEGDPVGCVVAASDGHVRAAPRSRRGVVGEIARLVDSVEPGGMRDVAPAIVAETSCPRIVVLSDLLGDLDAVIPAVRRHIAVGGEVHVVHIVAREELDPPRGAITAADPENARVRRPLVEAAREQYLAGFARWRRETADRMRATGATYLETVAGEAPDRVVRRIAKGGAG